MTSTANQSISEFTIDNSGRSFYHKMNSLGKFIKGGKARHFEKCTIIALESRVIIRVQGSEFYIPCRPTHNVMLDVYFTDVKEAVSNDRSAELQFIIQDRTLILNNRKLSCQVKRLNKKDFDLEAGLGSLNFGEI